MSRATPEQRAHAVRLRKMGWCCKTIGDALGFSKAAVASWTADLGLPPGTNLAAVRQAQAVSDAYFAGESIEDIAAGLEISASYVGWIIAGIHLRWPHLPHRTAGGRARTNREVRWSAPPPSPGPRVGALDVISWRRQER